MKRKLFGLLMAFVLIGSVLALPTAAVSASEVYYDSDVAGTWTEDEFGLKATNATISVGGIPTREDGESDEAYQERYAAAEKMIQLNASNDDKVSYGAIKLPSLNPDATYGFDHSYRVSMRFKRTGSRENEASVWPTLAVASGSYLKAGNFKPAAIAIADGYADFVSGLNDDDEVLYFIKGPYRGVYNSGKIIYPICVLGTTHDSKWHDVEYTYYIQNDESVNVYVRSLIVDGVAYETLPNGGKLTQDTSTALKTYCRYSFNNNTIDDIQYQNSGAIDIFHLPPANETSDGVKPGLAVSRLKYEGATSFAFEPLAVITDDEATAAEDCTVAHNGSLSLQFTGQYPEAVVSLISSGGATYSGTWQENTLCFDFSQNKLTVGENYRLTITAMGQSYTLSFTAVQGKEKLKTLSAPQSVEGGEVVVSVRNITDDDLSFTTRLALYQQQENGVVMLSYTDKAQTLSDGGDADLQTGSLTLPTEGGACWYKIFYLENEQSIAKAVTVGMAPQPQIASETVAEGLTAEPAEVTLEIAHVELPCTYAGVEAKTKVYASFCNPEGTPIYCDEITVASGSAFRYAFNLPVADSGLYSYQLKSDSGPEASGTFDVNFGSVAPTCSTPIVSGTPVLGETLTADYQYSHIAGVEEGESLIRWLSSTENKPESFENEIGTTAELKLEAGLLRQYVLVEVTPVNCDGIAGETKRSEVLYITAMPQADHLTISQSGNVLTASYQYSHAMGYEEKGTVFAWFISDHANEGFTQVGENKASYTLSSSDNGKYFKVSVQPISAASEDLTLEHSGKTVESAVYCASYKSSSGGGGSSSGGGGGSSSSSKKGSSATLKIPAASVSESDVSAGTIDLTDVRGHWAEKEIFSLYDKNIIKGRTEHTFEPNSSITRAEFASLLVRALQLSADGEAIDFADVSADSWYYTAMQAAAQYGLITGDGGYAYPERCITRAEMAAMIVRAYELTHEAIALNGDLLAFDDAASIPEWAVTYVCKAKEAGLVNGSDGLFRPHDNASRAEAAVMLERVMQGMNLEALTTPKEDEAPQLIDEVVDETQENISKEKDDQDENEKKLQEEGYYED